MRFLGGTTPATRLSLALALLTISVLLLADVIGLLPDHARAATEARLRLAEAVALQMSIAHQSGDTATLDAIGSAMIERNTELTSIGMRNENGTLEFATPGHAERWRQDDPDVADATQLRLPLFKNDEAWGTAELAFAPLAQPGGIGRGMRLSLFVALLGFLLYWTYLRRVLKHLDPSAVIPERVREMLDTMAEGVVVLDHRERVVLANQAFLSAAALPLRELQGRGVTEIPWCPPPGQKTISYPWAESPSGETQKGVELHLAREGHERQIFMVNCTPIISADGTYRGALATFDDVTAIEEKNVKLQKMVVELNAVRTKVVKQNEELQFLATRDALTNCLNRGALFERLHEEWEGAIRYKHDFSCIMLDIDHFKSINDNHGHATGDQVLQRVARTLKESTRSTDVVGRYGGEEFCILLAHTGIDEALQAAEKIRNRIATTDYAGITVTASLGVSSVGLGADEPKAMLDQADQALYDAKHSGRNRSVRWDAMSEESKREEPHRERESEVWRPSDVSIPLHAVTALITALAHRDPATAAHSRRVADLCMATAGDLMTAGDCFVLEIAALLHDIGKIGVPDAILLKPGPLTTEEWSVMETHDRIGVEIINSAFNSAELTNIVRNHHATFGGAGRDPGQPSGRDIPLRARILTIADAYDAMVSDRVYRKGRSPEEAFEELRRCSDTQFDPELVERFIGVVLSRQFGAEPRPASQSTEVVLSLGLATERLTAALDANDMKGVAAMANRLGTLATSMQWAEIAELAGELNEALDGDPDLAGVLESTRDLLNLCLSTQNDFLSAMGRKTDREAA